MAAFLILPGEVGGKRGGGLATRPTAVAHDRSPRRARGVGGSDFFPNELASSARRAHPQAPCPSEEGLR